MLRSHYEESSITRNRDKKGGVLLKESSKILSIIAYYLSEYDMQAVSALGYTSRNQAFREISARMGRENNYLKLRRDEFDALPTSSSSRKGWRNRPPLSDVVEMAHYLRAFSYEDLTEIVKSLIESRDSDVIDMEAVPREGVKLVEELSEAEIESIINSTDETAEVYFSERNTATRRYNRNIIKDLKKLYHGCCQICGSAPFGDGVDISEAHHIEYFSVSQNNNAGNIVILCPNHHRLIHKMNCVFNKETAGFILDDDTELPLKLNYHIETL